MEDALTADNTIDAPQAVQLLVDHIEEQERDRRKAKGTDKPYTPLPEDKAKRDLLLRQVLGALGCDRAELISRLRIDKATWDRWRSMATVPQRVHIEALTRFALGKDEATETKDEVSEPKSRPRPIDMLAVSPSECTWGRLRLVFSLYPWKDAVFCFPETFNDPQTVTEMALLALREDGKGCNIIYVQPAPEEWGPKYIKNLQKIFGKTNAARVLCKICAVKVPPEAMPEKGYGLFNFGPEGNSDLRAGYEWIYKGEGRPAEDDKEVYFPLSIGSMQFLETDKRLEEAIHQALDIIKGRELRDIWDPKLTEDTILEFSGIPVVDSEKPSTGKDDYSILDPRDGRIKRKSDVS